MEGKVTVIFVRGDPDNLVDKVIDTVSHGNFSHTAIKILCGVEEAKGEMEPGDKYPGVWLRNIDKYDNADAVFIDVDLPDIRAAEAEARRLIGTLYSYYGCVVTGLHDLTGRNILPADGELTVHCSETVTRILRAGSLNVLPDVPADDISPNDLYRELTRDAG